MQNIFENKIDTKTMSPLALAFMGDGVYEMFVREYLVAKGNSSVKRLHRLSVEMVRCEFQSKVVTEKLFDVFTQEEKDVFMRGRNTKLGHVPKNASRADYQAATALECLFGYLYLKNEINRLSEFFDIISSYWEINYEKG